MREVLSIQVYVCLFEDTCVYNMVCICIMHLRFIQVWVWVIQMLVFLRFSTGSAVHVFCILNWVARVFWLCNLNANVVQLATTNTSQHSRFTWMQYWRLVELIAMQETRLNTPAIVITTGYCFLITITTLVDKKLQQ